MKGTAGERFLAKLDQRGEDECWPWTAGRANEYGSFYPIPRRPVKAHRFAYELFVGPIPDGLQIDHLCSFKLCCNPSHLEPVTRAENGRRAWARGEQAPRPKPTGCKNGHPYDDSNRPYVRPATSTTPGAWQCRICALAASTRYRAKAR